MKRLYDALVEFVTTVDEKYCIANDNGSNKNLEEQFRLLACNFLYGGYISVNDRYRIYIRTVEFYFHLLLSGKKGNGIIIHPEALNCTPKVRHKTFGVHYV